MPDNKPNNANPPDNQGASPEEFVGSIRDELNVISRLSGLGSRDESMNNEFFGINHRGFNSAIPMNTDSHGLIFFTRPRLNLSYDNLAMVRELTPLLTDNERSYQRAIRAYLDPLSTFQSSGSSRQVVKTPLVDRNSPFIPLMTNTLMSLSGWPDPTLGTYTSTEGVYKEQWSMVDDIIRIYGTYTLTGTFRNIAGDPISLLLHTWLTYMSNVYLGTIMPYPDSIVENEIDYQTRIYKLTLDPSKRFVQKIAAANAAFPTANSFGTAQNYVKDENYSSENKQISMSFQCVGAIYNDPILVREFNTLQMIFNSNLMDGQRDATMRKLKSHEFAFFNFYGYPLIDPRTSELEWWVYKEDYALLAQYPEYDPNNSQLQAVARP